MDFVLPNNLLFTLVLLVWVLPWKGYSMWTASKRNHRGWFVALLILNTFSILDIIYIFFVAKKSWGTVWADVKDFLNWKEAKPPAA